MPITVRFQETERYDIQRDCEVVRFTAMGDRGTYWTEVPIEGPRGLRRDRERFRTLAVQFMRAGSLPCYIEIEDIEQ